MRRANTWSDAGRLHGHSFLVPYKWGQSFGIFLDHHLPKILVCCVSAQGRVKGWGEEGSWERESIRKALKAVKQSRMLDVRAGVFSSSQALSL